MESIGILMELQQGGNWLGACRSWLQSNVHDGDRLTWGSGQLVSIPFCKFEELALRVAVAAIEEDRRKRVKQKIPQRSFFPSESAFANSLNIS